MIDTEEEKKKWEETRLQITEKLRVKRNELTLLKEFSAVDQRYQNTLTQTLELLNKIYWQYVSKDFEMIKDVKKAINGLGKEKDESIKNLKDMTIRARVLQEEIKNLERG
jgi:hypothetical protein